MSTAHSGQQMFMKSQRVATLLISSKFGQLGPGSKNVITVEKTEQVFSVHPQDLVAKLLIISLVLTGTRKCRLPLEDQKKLYVKVAAKSLVEFIQDYHLNMLIPNADSR